MKKSLQFKKCVCYIEIFNSCIICAANNVRAGINFIVQIPLARFIIKNIMKRFIFFILLIGHVEILRTLVVSWFF
jgi:hypothetical protein